MKVRILSVVVGVLFLCGCAVKVTPESLLRDKKKELIVSGSSKEFVDGYVDGCVSGRRLIIAHNNYQAVKDQSRYTEEPDYSKGWEKGYYECREESIMQLQQDRQEYISTTNAAEEQERTKIWEDVRK